MASQALSVASHEALVPFSARWLRCAVRGGRPRTIPLRRWRPCASSLRFSATRCAISKPNRFPVSKTVRRASGGALGPRPDHSSPLTLEGDVPGPARGPRRSLAGICLHPGDAHGIWPFAAFILPVGRPAFRPPQPTCRSLSHQHRGFCVRWIARDFGLCVGRSIRGGRPRLLGFPDRQAAPHDRNRGPLLPWGSASSRYSDALMRAGRVSSPWPTTDSGNRFRFL